MHPYQNFNFDSFQVDEEARRIVLAYSFDNALHFTEYFDLPAELPLTKINDPAVQAALFALHLAGGISYYKAYCPPHIQVRSGHLTKEQAEFWNHFYTHGLGEFFYQNNIDFRHLISFPHHAEVSEVQSASTDTSTASLWYKNHKRGEDSAVEADGPSGPQRALVPFGGGKDSVVTMELLRKQGINQTLFRLRSHHFIDRLVEQTGLPIITLERQLDTQLLELNTQGALNGHVPITGYIGFLTIVVALLGGFDSVWFSNERSADFGSVEYLGIQVNHQWSKSLEAEELQRSYIRRFITPDVQFASLLRPFGELRIAQLFAHYPQYFQTTTSCNVNWKMLGQNPSGIAWCGTCYKCAFMFALYAATLPDGTAIKMFGKNMFTDQSLLHTYRQLWGAEGIKPFDCVGTIAEMQAAMHLALKKPEYANTLIGKDFETRVLPKITNPEKLIGNVLTPDIHGVPHTVRTLLKGTL